MLSREIKRLEIKRSWSKWL